MKELKHFVDFQYKRQNEIAKFVLAWDITVTNDKIEEVTLSNFKILIYNITLITNL